MAVPNTAIIVNPASGTSNGTENLKSITKNAQTLGFTGVILTTTKSKSAGEIAKAQIKKGVTRIIVCGGDGTILDVLKVCIDTKTALGIIPLGTGNLFARNLQVPLSIPESMQTALGDKSTKIDVGWVNNRYFTVIAGIGIDAKIMKDASPILKKKIGLLAYMVSGIKNVHTKRNDYEITVDTRSPKIYTAKSILVANMDKIQGGIQIVPHANPQSGSLKLGIIQAKSKLHFFSLLLNSLHKGIHKSPHYTLLTCNTAEIKVLHGKMPYQCDGDTFPPTDTLVIKVFPKALTVHIP